MERESQSGELEPWVATGVEAQVPLHSRPQPVLLPTLRLWSLLGLALGLQAGGPVASHGAEASPFPRAGQDLEAEGGVDATRPPRPNPRFRAEEPRRARRGGREARGRCPSGVRPALLDWPDSPGVLTDSAPAGSVGVFCRVDGRSLSGPGHLGLGSEEGDEKQGFPGFECRRRPRHEWATASSSSSRCKPSEARNARHRIGRTAPGTEGPRRRQQRERAREGRRREGPDEAPGRLRDARLRGHDPDVGGADAVNSKRLG